MEWESEGEAVKVQAVMTRLAIFTVIIGGACFLAARFQLGWWSIPLGGVSYLIAAEVAHADYLGFVRSRSA